jgi:hypothetical protein
VSSITAGVRRAIDQEERLILVTYAVDVFVIFELEPDMLDRLAIVHDLKDGQFLLVVGG